MKPGDLLISDFPDIHTPQPILVLETFYTYFRGIDPKGKLVEFPQWGWKVINETG